MVWFVLASSSAVLSAAAAIIQKKVLLRSHALEFSFVLSLFIMALSLYIPLSMDISGVPVWTLMFIFAKGIVGGLAFLCVMTALERDQISSVLPLLGLTPAVTALVSFLAAGEALKDWEWLGVGLVVAGTYLLERRPTGDGFVNRWSFRLTPSHYYIGAALVLFALSSTADKMLVSGYKTDPQVVLIYQHAAYCLTFGVLLWIRKVPMKVVIRKGRDQWPYLVAIAILTIGYRLTQLEATKDAPVALVLAVKRTSILYASVLGGKLFSEERLGVKLAGAVLIVASGFVILRNVG
jgi:drug/metabolite transporter (DMT)-like permease